MRISLFVLFLFISPAAVLADDKPDIAELKRKIAETEAKLADLKSQLMDAESKGKPGETITLTPPKNGHILLADSSSLLTYITRNPSTFNKWEKEGTARKLTEPTEAELVKREKTYSKVRIEEKEWMVATESLPSK